MVGQTKMIPQLVHGPFGNLNGEYRKEYGGNENETDSNYF